MLFKKTFIILLTLFAPLTVFGDSPIDDNTYTEAYTTQGKHFHTFVNEDKHYSLFTNSTKSKLYIYNKNGQIIYTSNQNGTSSSEWSYLNQVTNYKNGQIIHIKGRKSAIIDYNKLTDTFNIYTSAPGIIESEKITEKTFGSVYKPFYTFYDGTLVYVFARSLIDNNYIYHYIYIDEYGFANQIDFNSNSSTLNPIFNYPENDNSYALGGRTYGDYLQWGYYNNQLFGITRKGQPFYFIFNENVNQGNFYYTEHLDNIFGINEVNYFDSSITRFDYGGFNVGNFIDSDNKVLNHISITLTGYNEQNEYKHSFLSCIGYHYEGDLTDSLNTGWINFWDGIYNSYLDILFGAGNINDYSDYYTNGPHCLRIVDKYILPYKYIDENGQRIVFFAPKNEQRENYDTNILNILKYYYIKGASGDILSLKIQNNKIYISNNPISEVLYSTISSTGQVDNNDGGVIDDIITHIDGVNSPNIAGGICNSDNQETGFLSGVSNFFSCSWEIISSTISNIFKSFGNIKDLFAKISEIGNTDEFKSLDQAFHFFPQTYADYNPNQDPLAIASQGSFEDIPLLKNIYNLLKYTGLAFLLYLGFIYIFKHK